MTNRTPPPTPPVFDMEPLPHEEMRVIKVKAMFQTEQCFFPEERNLKQGRPLSAARPKNQGTKTLKVTSEVMMPHKFENKLCLIGSLQWKSSEWIGPRLSQLHHAYRSTQTPVFLLRWPSMHKSFKIKVFQNHALISSFRQDLEFFRFMSLLLCGLSAVFFLVASADEKSFLHLSIVYGHVA